MNHWDPDSPQPGQTHPAEASVSGFVFDIRRFGGRMSISEEVLRTAEMHTELNRVLGELLVGIDIRVLSHHLLSRTQTQRVGFPANPWQHLKARFGPAWFLQRWPVRKTWSEITFHIDVDAAFPQAMIPLTESRLGPASFHEDAYFETATCGAPYVEYRQQPMSYQDLRNHYAERAEREARIRKQAPASPTEWGPAMRDDPLFRMFRKRDT